MLVRAAAALVTGLALGPAGAADLRPGPAGRQPVADVRVAPAGVLLLNPGITEVLRTARPARTVVVGDPRVAEASVANETTVLLTGKTAGFTNLILLDENGDEFYRRIVRVGTPPRPIVVYRGETVQRYQCDPICNQPSDRLPQGSGQETVEAGSAGAPPAGPPAAEGLGRPVPQP